MKLKITLLPLFVILFWFGLFWSLEWLRPVIFLNRTQQRVALLYRRFLKFVPLRWKNVQKIKHFARRFFPAEGQYCTVRTHREIHFWTAPLTSNGPISTTTWTSDRNLLLKCTGNHHNNRFHTSRGPKTHSNPSGHVEAHFFNLNGSLLRKWAHRPRCQSY